MAQATADWDPWSRLRAGAHDQRGVRIGDGVYRVEIDGRAEVVFVAGPLDESMGVLERAQCFAARGQTRPRPPVASPARRTSGADRADAGDGPEGARHAGHAGQEGRYVVILEAMKMELPLRAPG